MRKFSLLIFMLSVFQVVQSFADETRWTVTPVSIQVAKNFQDPFIVNVGTHCFARPVAHAQSTSAKKEKPLKSSLTTTPIKLEPGEELTFQINNPKSQEFSAGEAKICSAYVGTKFFDLPGEEPIADCIDQLAKDPTNRLCKLIVRDEEVLVTFYVVKK